MKAEDLYLGLDTIQVLTDSGKWMDATVTRVAEWLKPNGTIVKSFSLKWSGQGIVTFVRDQDVEKLVRERHKPVTASQEEEWATISKVRAILRAEVGVDVLVWAHKVMAERDTDYCSPTRRRR